jgi:hypothetical protein
LVILAKTQCDTFHLTTTVLTSPTISTWLANTALSVTQPNKAETQQNQLMQ